MLDKRNEIAANGLFYLHILDAKSLKTKRKIFTGFGVKVIDVDAENKVLYVGQYLSGKLSAYDLDSGKLIGTVLAGPLIRSLSVCPTNGKIYVGSTFGVFEFDPTHFRN
jgi:DNA-binding beta-propeller fold protein YncE